MIIDAHTHLFKEFYPNYSYMGLTSEIERVVGRLFGDGKLDQAWVMAFPGVKQEAGDDEVLAVCKRYPAQFVPFGYLDLRASPSRIEELHRRGFVGLKSIFPPKPYDHESLFPFYDKAQALRMPILFHTGNCGIFPAGVLTDEFDLPSQSTAYHRPQAMRVLAKRFPELRMMMGHAGVPWHMEAAQIATECPHVYLEISAYPDQQAMRDMFAAGLDPGKVLFGSDFPVNHPLERLYFWENFFTWYLKLSKDAQRKIFGENARELLASLKH